MKYLQPNNNKKAHIKEPIANILNNDKRNILSIRLGTGQGCLISQF